MNKIVAVANQKGGVGKTTTSVNLASGLALSQYPILLVDLDPQANATSGLGIESPEKTVYECFAQEGKAQDIIAKTSISGLDLLPSCGDLVGAEVELASVPDREQVLKTCLQEVQEQYEYIIIDCPPALGLLTINALVAAHSVLIPVQCEYYAMEGLSRLLANIERVKESYNANLEIEGILLTMYDSRITLSRQVSDEVKNHFPEKVYKTVIPRNVALAEAPSYGQSVLLYNSASAGARAYSDLAKEFSGNGEKSTG